MPRLQFQLSDLLFITMLTGSGIVIIQKLTPFMNPDAKPMLMVSIWIFWAVVCSVVGIYISNSLGIVKSWIRCGQIFTSVFYLPALFAFLFGFMMMIAALFYLIMGRGTSPQLWEWGTGLIMASVMVFGLDRHIKKSSRTKP